MTVRQAHNTAAAERGQLSGKSLALWVGCRFVVEVNSEGGAISNLWFSGITSIGI